MRNLRGFVVKRFFVSKTKFEVGSRIGLEEGTFFLNAKDANRHYVADGGHMFEVETEQDDFECGTVTKWLSSDSGIHMNMDENVVFKGVPDKKEILGRMENKNQGAAFVHNPKKKEGGGKRWMHSGKSEFARILQRIIDSKT